MSIDALRAYRAIRNGEPLPLPPVRQDLVERFEAAVARAEIEAAGKDEESEGPSTVRAKSK